jgi:hypothetical protein
MSEVDDSWKRPGFSWNGMKLSKIVTFGAYAPGILSLQPTFCTLLEMEIRTYLFQGPY